MLNVPCYIQIGTSFISRLVFFTFFSQFSQFLEVDNYQLIAEQLLYTLELLEHGQQLRNLIHVERLHLPLELFSTVRFISSC